MEQIKVTSEIMINEFDHQSLGGAMAAERIMRALSEGEIETAQESANQILFVFKENYESGMELGDWQKVADAVYERNTEDENQTTQTTSEPSRQN